MDKKNLWHINFFLNQEFSELDYVIRGLKQLGFEKRVKSKFSGTPINKYFKFTKLTCNLFNLENYIWLHRWL